MKTLLASILIAAAAVPAAAGPDFVAPARPAGTKPLAASPGTRPMLPEDDVVFEHDSAVLIPSAHQQIETVAGWLKTHPRENIVLAGHADTIGTAVYNEDLATRRAQAVRQHLMSHGIPSDRIIVVVYGESGSDRKPSPTDRRVVMFATDDLVRKVVAMSLGEHKGVTAMWTHNGVLFTETHGTRGLTEQRSVATRR